MTSTTLLALPPISESNALWERATGLIPAGTQTLAKGPGQYVKGVAPKYARRGKGATLWDVDGNAFLDMSMGIGPLVLGYGYDRVDEAIRAQLNDGITFSLMHPLEVEVAELVREMVPCAESVRFSKTGADVTSAAVRVARAMTGRNTVLCCGYHGWHDWYIAVTDRNKGIPAGVQDLSFTFDYNSTASFDASLDDDVACVILEPTVFEEPKPGFLEHVRAQCTARGIVLIFDEMWTGFRMATGGAQQHYGVTPDLATFSKAIANGMPLSVLCGRADLMNVLKHDTFFFTTFGGEALSLAAAQATMLELRERDVPAHLWRNGQRVKDGYNGIATELGIDAWTRCIGPATRSAVVLDATAGPPLALKSLLQQELIRRGVLWTGSHAMSFAHGDEEVQQLLDAYREALTVLKDAVTSGTVQTQIAGELVEPVFRRTSNFNMKPARA
jgi:glutamate-1-semialdehyde aminotransferase